ncbi:hypothetical protein AB0J72_50390 [Dactylosporangium sp. NPDC049742]|uniref:hypothetical protein n=1 Tax=Dactylosporangium sp. NPDC049742 TaxID=3154737 RepID=UPI0034221C8D
MDLIAGVDASADNILDHSVTPACQAYVIGEHVVRIPALTAARAVAPEGMRLRVRALDQPLPPGRSFRVDLDSGAVVEVRNRAQP